MVIQQTKDRSHADKTEPLQQESPVVCTRCHLRSLSPLYNALL